MDDLSIEKILSKLDEAAEREGQMMGEIGRMSAQITSHGRRLGQHSMRVKGVEQEGNTLESAVGSGQFRLTEIERAMAEKQVEIYNLKEHIDDLRRASSAVATSEEERDQERRARKWGMRVYPILIGLVEVGRVLLDLL